MNIRLFSLFASAVLLMQTPILPASARPQNPGSTDAGAVTSPAAPGSAQPDDSASRLAFSSEPLAVDSLERLDSVDTDLVSLRRSAEGEEVVLEVGGFGITLSALSDEQFKDRNKRVKRPRFNMVALYDTELGFNILSGLDYGACPVGTGDFLDLRGGKSFHFSTTLVGLNFAFGKQRQFDITTGVRYTVDNYRLSDNSITLGNENGMIVPLTLDEKAGKSKLRITSLGIPLHLACHPAKGLTLSLSGYFDFTMGANSIYKDPKTKNSLSGVRPFQFGVGFGASYYRVGVYLRYGVTPLFKSNVGPKVHPLSIGFCIGL